MDVTELAHWKYRLKALPSDIEACKKAHSAASRWASELRFGEVHSAKRGETADDRRERGAQVIRDRRPRNTFDDEVDKLASELVLLRFLLEEAKYMVELGELTLV